MVCLGSYQLQGKGSVEQPVTALQGLPRNGSPGTVALYAAVLLIFALLKAWPGEAGSRE